VDAQEALTIARRLGHRGWTATSWRAVGIAQQTSGELDAALEAFGQSLACSEHLGLFASWAAARSALVLVALDRATQAEPLVRRAGVEGPPLGHYEARLAEVELAVALGRAGVARLAAAALARAVAGGHLASVARLTSLTT
jgi:hypothetical protein